MNCYKFTIYQYVPRLASLWTVSLLTLICFLFRVGRNEWAYIKMNACFMRWKRKQSSNSTWKISPNCIRVVTHINNDKNKSTEIGGKSEILSRFVYLQEKCECVPLAGARSFTATCKLQKNIASSRKVKFIPWGGAADFKLFLFLKACNRYKLTRQTSMLSIVFAHLAFWRYGLYKYIFVILWVIAIFSPKVIAIYCGITYQEALADFLGYTGNRRNF